MKNYFIAKSRRLRSTPYTSRIEKQGVTNYTTYNHMLLPAGFELSLEDSYYHLKKYVQIWDVAAERQVEVTGKDSAKLVQLMTCRDLSKSKNGRCYYCPIIDDKGGLINDPIVLRISEEKWWLSIADSDVMLFAKGLAIGYKFDVEVDEPDVSPLQVQGPNSAQLMANVFGDWVHDLGFYRFKEFNHEGIPMVIARMGYSRELCYEIFLQDHSKGDELWECLWQAGQDLNISAGGPNIILRLEGGILSYLADLDRTNNPYEVGLDWMIDLDEEDDFIGKEALREINIKGPLKKLMGAEIEGDPINDSNEDHLPVLIDGKVVGSMNAMVYSPRLDKNLSYVFLDIEHARVGQEIIISSPDKDLKAKLVDLPWLGRAKK